MAKRRRQPARPETRQPQAPPVPTDFYEMLFSWSEEAAEHFELAVYDVAIDGAWRISVSVEKPGSSIGDSVTIDACANVSRYIETYLDADDSVYEKYSIEVGSPGVERVLKKPRHFFLSTGRNARLVLRENVDGQNVVEGVIESADETEAGSVVVRSDDASRTIPFGIIAKAHLTYEF